MALWFSFISVRPRLLRCPFDPSCAGRLESSHSLHRCSPQWPCQSGSGRASTAGPDNAPLLGETGDARTRCRAPTPCQRRQHEPLAGARRLAWYPLPERILSSSLCSGLPSECRTPTQQHRLLPAEGAVDANTPARRESRHSKPPPSPRPQGSGAARRDAQPLASLGGLSSRRSRTEQKRRTADSRPGRSSPTPAPVRARPRRTRSRTGGPRTPGRMRR